MNLHKISSPQAPQFHVEIPRSNERPTRQDGFALFGLLHVDGAVLIQALGHGLGVVLRHVLHEQNRREIDRKSRKETPQRFRASHRASNRNDESRRYRQVRWREGRDRPGMPPHAGPGGGAHLPDDLPSELFKIFIFAAIGFRDEIHRAFLEGGQGDLRPRPGERADHNDRKRVRGHEPGEEGNAVLARHLHVQRHAVGLMDSHFISGGTGVRRDIDHLDVGRLSENLSEKETLQRRILDNQNTDLPTHLRRPFSW